MAACAGGCLFLQVFVCSYVFCGCRFLLLWRCLLVVVVLVVGVMLIVIDG